MLRAGFDSLLSLTMFLVFTGFAVAALVFAAMAREDAYRAADKQTKKFWLIILGVNLVLNLLLPMLFLQIAGVIAAIVFMVDVRPALAQVSGGGRGSRGGGSSSDGPYGPYNGGR
ncbi:MULTISPECIES: DUF2516 family protein [Streptomyces]|uniref:DUF2516 family protein n=1 Tax=Streptomyces cinereoruber TaxID=67260 RepID=A0ABX6BP71_9ACTN|nr:MULTISPECIES: DUF2516 family protein [Streptomyces]AVH96285.1 DUF2516 domain-containing protein [Streptomyces sp. WAC00288]KYG54940.1 hypothetical protein AWI43_11100 [Streptomyces sp. WAC04657]MBB4156706.1 uncharacterized membrane protein YjgN (DUF898 family) [Streptomyces cinereoruber]MBY8815465.1 DUF2516 family protein [Streptomyces cinereoruber]NIH60196.1 uncharacterized membrane protein YjgN (DUF898 family) [Streptomyces cinereoruber]